MGESYTTSPVEKQRFPRILCGFLYERSQKVTKIAFFRFGKRRSTRQKARSAAWHNQNMSCSLCEKRKEKRFCPALHERICPQCCGEQREVTLDCPSSCPYLLQAREHEKPRPIEDLDPTLIFPQVQISERFVYEHEHLIAGLTFAMAKAIRANHRLTDNQIFAALAALARSYETLINSGLHYDMPLAGLGQQALVSEIQQIIKEYRETEQKHIGYVRLHDSEVLQGLVFLLRMGLSRSSGRPKSRAFSDFVLGAFPEQSSPAGASTAASSIILP